MSEKNSKSAAVTTLDDAPSASAPAAAASPKADLLIKHSAELTGKRKILTIHAESGPGGSHAVFVGLNGVGYQVPRGKPWNVPAELVENLKNATQTVYERDENDKMIQRESPRFGFTVEDAPSIEAAAVAA
jgi:hypothetical protein